MIRCDQSATFLCDADASANSLLFLFFLHWFSFVYTLFFLHVVCCQSRWTRELKMNSCWDTSRRRKWKRFHGFQIKVNKMHKNETTATMRFFLIFLHSFILEMMNCWEHWKSVQNHLAPWNARKYWIYVSNVWKLFTQLRLNKTKNCCSFCLIGTRWHRKTILFDLFVAWKCVIWDLWMKWFSFLSSHWFSTWHCIFFPQSNSLLSNKKKKPSRECTTKRNIYR